MIEEHDMPAITGVWISPDQTMIAIQYDEDAIDVVSTEYAQLMDLEEAGLEAVGVPSDWLPLSPPETASAQGLEWHV